MDNLDQFSHTNWTWTVWIFSNQSSYLQFDSPMCQFIHFENVSLGLNHYWAFSYFGIKYFSFLEVLAYFTVCLWMVPFLFFVSLSANDQILPTTSERGPLLREDDLVSHYFSANKKRYGLLYFFNYVKDLTWISSQKQF